MFMSLFGGTGTKNTLSMVAQMELEIIKVSFRMQTCVHIFEYDVWDVATKLKTHKYS